MKKSIFRKSLVIGIIILFLGASAISTAVICDNITIDINDKSSELISNSNSKGNILIYATWSPYASNGYTKASYTDLADILSDYGYSVTLTDRSETPIITDSLLSGYTELWISNSEYDWYGFFTSPEISAILNFREMGNGLMLNADHSDPHGGGFVHTVNQVAIPLGVTFYGWANHGSSPISPDFDDHPLFEGVTSIEGNKHEAYLAISSPSVAVATYQGDDIIAVRDDGKGRVVFDSTLYRLMNGGSHVLVADNPQYVRNIADWIGNDPPNTPNKPLGIKLGKVGIIYSYTTKAIDPDEDQVYYKWDWGDGSFSDWLGPFDSGTLVSESHAWGKGDYEISVKAKDESELESDWSEPLSITMPRNRAIMNTPFLQFLQQYPILYQLLQRFLRL